MPCYDHDYPREINAIHTRIDKLTRMLCEAMDRLESLGADKLSNELEFWWIEHKRADRQRKKREEEVAIKATEMKAALAKLTDKERKLLRLK